jgi:Methyltransferase domain
MIRFARQTLYQLHRSRFRRKRMELFLDTFRPLPETTVLDSGGTPFDWYLVDCEARITLLNLGAARYREYEAENMFFVEGDATTLPYTDRTFDIGFSNSVIEHLSTYENQAKFAREIKRVCNKLWVQTPARAFPVEPHLVTPFVHYLPKRWQRHLLRNFTLWGLVTRPSSQDIEEYLREVRLLSYREMRNLFPDCEVRKERFLFLTKAYIAIRC